MKNKSGFSRIFLMLMLTVSLGYAKPSYAIWDLFNDSVDLITDSARSTVRATAGACKLVRDSVVEPIAQVADDLFEPCLEVLGLESSPIRGRHILEGSLLAIGLANDPLTTIAGDVGMRVVDQVISISEQDSVQKSLSNQQAYYLKTEQFGQAAREIMVYYQRDPDPSLVYLRQFDNVYQYLAVLSLCDGRKKDIVGKMPGIVKFNNRFQVLSLEAMVRAGRTIDQTIHKLAQITTAEQYNKILKLLKDGKSIEYNIDKIIRQYGPSCGDELT